jgi:hypothetical protein
MLQKWQSAGSSSAPLDDAPAGVAGLAVAPPRACRRRMIICRATPRREGAAILPTPGCAAGSSPPGARARRPHGRDAFHRNPYLSRKCPANTPTTAASRTNLLSSSTEIGLARIATRNSTCQQRSSSWDHVRFRGDRRPAPTSCCGVRFRLFVTPLLTCCPEILCVAHLHCGTLTTFRSGKSLLLAEAAHGPAISRR